MRIADSQQEGVVSRIEIGYNVRKVTHLGQELSSMSKVTVREAALLTGKSRETINTACNDGVLSHSLNERNHKVIDVAELERVYPPVRTMEALEQSDVVQNGRNLTESGSSDVREQVAVLKERLEAFAQQTEVLKSERERERRQLESEIENLRSSLAKSQEQHGKATLLLTHHQEEQGRETAQALKVEELEAKMKKLALQNRRIYEALQQERSQTLWKRLFG